MESTEMHTLHKPLPPNQVVESNLLLEFHFDSFEVLPFWWDQLSPENRSIKYQNNDKSIN